MIDDRYRAKFDRGHPRAPELYADDPITGALVLADDIVNKPTRQDTSAADHDDRISRKLDDVLSLLHTIACAVVRDVETTDHEVSNE